MGKLDCQKKLAKLDELRDTVRIWMADLIVWSRALAGSLKDAITNMGDAAALKELDRQLSDFTKFADPSTLEGFVDDWEAAARKFRQEVWDAVVDQVEREKNKGELATTCVPIKDYVEASESEIKTARGIVAIARVLSKFAEAFAKAMKQPSPTP